MDNVDAVADAVALEGPQGQLLVVRIVLNEEDLDGFFNLGHGSIVAHNMA